jgi:hypothetical protein
MTSLKVPMSIYFFDIVQLWMFSLWWVNVFSLFMLLIDVHYLLNFPSFIWIVPKKDSNMKAGVFVKLQNKILFTSSSMQLDITVP